MLRRELTAQQQRTAQLGELTADGVRHLLGALAGGRHRRVRDPLHRLDGGLVQRLRDRFRRRDEQLARPGPVDQRGPVDQTGPGDQRGRVELGQPEIRRAVRDRGDEPVLPADDVLDGRQRQERWEFDGLGRRSHQPRGGRTRDRRARDDQHPGEQPQAAVTPRFPVGFRHLVSASSASLLAAM
ncbi:hypothetical protein ACFQ0O_38000 [Saccharopolyspora spinosporotrichia]